MKLILIFLSLILSACGPGASTECHYHNKLKQGQARNITAKGNQAIKNLQKEIIACGLGNKSCKDNAIKSFGKAHNCNP